LEAERELEKSRKSVFDASISASVGFNQVADNFGGAYGNPLRQDMVSIGLTVPVLDWGVRKGRINMAKSNLAVRKLSVQQKKQNIEQELISTIDNFNNQRRLLGSAQEVLTLASDSYRINRKRFIVGKVDMSTLSFSLERYKDAQRNYVNSLKYYWGSYYKIRKLTLYDFEKKKNLSALMGPKTTNL
jgi:outer membrane protein TolC